MEDRDPFKSLSKLINRGELKEIMQKAIDQGPNNTDDPLKRKTTGVEQEDALDLNQNLEYYPTLILSSFFLAEYYN